MKHLNLGPGGIIGGLVGAAGLAAVEYLLYLVNVEGRFPLGSLTGFGLVGGVVAGNYLWALVFPSKENPPDDGDVTHRE